MDGRMVSRLWWCVAAAALGVLAVAGGFFEEQVTARRDRWGLFGSKPYFVYVVSNIPEEAVMGPVCGDALRVMHAKKAHCVYVPLAKLGTFGKRKKDLLPFDPMQYSETVAIIDRATLIEPEKTALRALRAKVFPQTPETADAARVLVWLQNGGKTGGEFQVLIDLPSLRWLSPTLQEIHSLPVGTLFDKSRASKSIVRQITRTAILANDAPAADMLVAALPFDEVQSFGLRQIDAYLRTAVTRRILALNWNGEEECAPAVAARILPPPLRDRATELTPDGNGLTGWQRFCRQASAQRIADEQGETWVIAAPTAPYLRQLMETVVRGGFSGGPYQLALTDLTGVTALAVGVRVIAKDFTYERAEVQRRLERAAETVLKCRVRAQESMSGGDLRMVDDALLATTNAAPLPAGIDALLVVSLDSFTPRVTYTTTHQRVTPPYPVFTLREPLRPLAPDPDERRELVKKVYDYPGITTKERRASAAFQKDYAAWEDLFAQWETDHKAWEERKAAWEAEHPPVQTVLGTIKPKFPEKEPAKPKEPNPDAGKDVTYYAYLYPGGTTAERRRSMEYQRTYDVWRMKELPIYHEAYHRWEDARLRWEEDRNSYPVDYEYTVTGTSSVKSRGHLLLVLHPSPAQPVRPIAIEGNSEQTTHAPESFASRVYGEDTAPAAPQALAAFRDLADWRDVGGSREEESLNRIGRNAAYDAVERGLARLAATALWAGDLKPWNRIPAL